MIRISKSVTADIFYLVKYFVNSYYVQYDPVKPRYHGSSEMPTKIYKKYIILITYKRKVKLNARMVKQSFSKTVFPADRIFCSIFERNVQLSREKNKKVLIRIKRFNCYWSIITWFRSTDYTLYISLTRKVFVFI